MIMCGVRGVDVTLIGHLNLRRGRACVLVWVVEEMTEMALEEIDRDEEAGEPAMR